MPRYNTNYIPPAAIISISVSNPFNAQNGPVTGDAKIDSGGCKTIIPETWSHRLGLVPTRRQTASAFNSRSQDIDMSIVTITFNGHSFREIEVGIAARNDALIGRDILNQFAVTLDGRNLNFEIV